MKAMERQRKGDVKTSTESFFPPLPTSSLGVSQNLSCGLINSSKRIIEKFALVRTYSCKRECLGGRDLLPIASSLHPFAPLPPTPTRKKKNKGEEREKIVLQVGQGAS